MHGQGCRVGVLGQGGQEKARFMPGKAFMCPVRCDLRTCRWCMDHCLLASVWMSMPSLSEGTAPCHGKPSLEEALIARCHIRMVARLRSKSKQAVALHW